MQERAAVFKVGSLRLTGIPAVAALLIVLGSIGTRSVYMPSTMSTGRPSWALIAGLP